MPKVEGTFLCSEFVLVLQFWDRPIASSISGPGRGSSFKSALTSMSHNLCKVRNDGWMRGFSVTSAMDCSTEAYVVQLFNIIHLFPVC